MERPLALNEHDPVGDHNVGAAPADGDPSLTRARLYLRASGVRDESSATLTRQLQAAVDPDAPPDIRTRLLVDRAMTLGRPALDDLALPVILPASKQRRQVHRQELGKPMAALRPGWWRAPWRRLWRQWKRRGDDD
ncbi:MAG: hypothetical protein ACYC26_02425 [Phycisphaerales bacterium]